jgi:AsmA protein
MKTVVRFLLWFVGALVALGLLLIIALQIFIDPNDYRDEIETAVNDATGRTLSIEGDLGLQFFPCCGIQLGPLMLSNPPGFGDENFLEVDNASVSVQVLPLLLSQELVVGQVGLDGPELVLISKADGTNNWTFGDEVAADEPATEPTGEGAAGADAISVAGFELREGKLTYVDEALGDRIEVSDINLSTGAISDGQAFEAEGGLTVTGAVPDVVLAAQLKTMVAANLAAGTATLESLELQTDATGSGVPGGAAEVAVQAAAVRDLGAAIVQVEGASLRVGIQDLVLETTASGRIEDGTPQLSGGLTIPEFQLRGTLPALDVEVPVTADPAVLGGTRLTADWAFDGNVANISNLNLGIDDTKVSGKASFAVETSRIEFDLQLDDIDLDRYTEPVAETTTGSAGDDAARDKDEELDLPVEDMRELNAKGRVRLAKVVVAEATLTEVDLNLNAQKGLIELKPLSAKLYGGNYSDAIVVDVQGAEPKFRLNPFMMNFRIGEFLTDTQEFKNLSGLANFTMSVRTRGNSENALLQNLTGNMKLQLKEARYEGIDLWYELRDAKAVIKNDPRPKEPANPYTNISNFSGSATFADGVARNEDFLADIPFIQLTGAGDVYLLREELDYELKAKVTGVKRFEDGYSMEDLNGVAVPVTLTGAIEDPKVSVDVATVLKSLTERKLKDRLMEKLDEKFKFGN